MAHVTAPGVRNLEASAEILTLKNTLAAFHAAHPLVISQPAYESAQADLDQMWATRRARDGSARRHSAGARKCYSEIY